MEGWYEDGNHKYEAEYKDGMKNGMYVFFYENGNRKLQEIICG